MKRLLETCYFINLILLILFLFEILNVIVFNGGLNELYTNKIFMHTRLVLTIPVLILWFKTLKIWSNYDRKFSRLLLILFFIGVYTPFYYKKMTKYSPPNR